jgi:hypothetical protein
MRHLILLGDSIFDNERYTSGGPPVVRQVRSLLPAGWQASLRAIDGSVAGDVPRQAGRIPADATHLVLSAGGNDALQKVGVIDAEVSSAGEALALLANIADSFGRDYRQAVEACLRCNLPLAVCTIYNGRFDPVFQRLVSVALMVFNDVIIRTAVEKDLPVIDLRSICALAEDYANPIEPSSIGGEKIARAIVGLVTESHAGGARLLGCPMNRA